MHIDLPSTGGSFPQYWHNPSFLYVILRIYALFFILVEHVSHVSFPSLAGLMQHIEQKPFAFARALRFF
jgi:hypothetical protein